MAELKTKPTDQSVEEFIDTLPEPRMREDSRAILAMMRETTGTSPVLWGSGIIGFGNWRYKYASGREGDWFRVGFAPRKKRLTFYVTPGAERERLLNRLGKHKTGGGCIYVNRLADIDPDVLRELIIVSWKAAGESI